MTHWPPSGGYHHTIITQSSFLLSCLVEGGCLYIGCLFLQDNLHDSLFHTPQVSAETLFPAAYPFSATSICPLSLPPVQLSVPPGILTATPILHGHCEFCLEGIVCACVCVGMFESACVCVCVCVPVCAYEGPRFPQSLFRFCIEIRSLAEP